MVCWVGIVLSNFLQLYPFLAEGKILQQTVARPTHSRHPQQRFLQHHRHHRHHHHYYFGILWSTDALLNQTRGSEQAVPICQNLRFYSSSPWVNIRHSYWASAW